MSLRAAMLMLASTLAFGLMVVAIRLASAHLSTVEIAFFRNLFGLLFLLPMLLRPGQPLPRTAQLPRYLLRTAVGLVSMLAGFWAIGHLPLSQAIALSYSTPLFVTLAAAFWLGENVRLRRWMAVLCGFAGVLIIVRPGAATFSTGTLVALLAAVMSALVAIQIKQLARADSANTVVFYTYVFWVPMSLLPALFAWTWPHGIDWLWLLATGLFGTLGQLLWTRALRIGEVSALTPISFIQLPFVALLGWWLFGEAIAPHTLLGAAIIIAANVYIAHRESVLAKRAATHAPMEGAKPGE
ncbi:DMT family transporter [Xanthomonas sp. NCPPB 2654]|uniref:DMT family transporter n=1 Tax=unclassified Xanthomonas TaxID=2643310 RepID=UPI0021DF67F2|nr:MULTISPECIES: DMT family transporter [unclassified Xanthomonas]MDL5367481.1 DMT family transporter [Xanthomonas sp. NCPPB 2654]UYC22867.1 DMT family transporter [Xanthomonas sp. CFBP 8443]